MFVLSNVIGSTVAYLQPFLGQQQPPEACIKTFNYTRTQRKNQKATNDTHNVTYTNKYKIDVFANAGLQNPLPTLSHRV